MPKKTHNEEHERKVAMMKKEAAERAERHREEARKKLGSALYEGGVDVRNRVRGTYTHEKMLSMDQKALEAEYSRLSYIEKWLVRTIAKVELAADRKGMKKVDFSSYYRPIIEYVKDKMNIDFVTETAGVAAANIVTLNNIVKLQETTPSARLGKMEAIALFVQLNVPKFSWGSVTSDDAALKKAAEKEAVAAAAAGQFGVGGPENVKHKLGLRVDAQGNIVSVKDEQLRPGVKGTIPLSGMYTEDRGEFGKKAEAGTSSLAAAAAKAAQSKQQSSPITSAGPKNPPPVPPRPERKKGS